MTIDTRDINELGPRKFRTRAVNGEEQTCYFNRIKSDTHFTTFYAKRAQSELIRFSIINHNSDFARVNKSLDFNQDSLLSNGQFEKELEQSNTENLKNGKSFTNRSTTTKSTDVRERQRSRELRRNSRDESASARKKPRFLANK